MKAAANTPWRSKSEESSPKVSVASYRRRKKIGVLGLTRYADATPLNLFCRAPVKIASEAVLRWRLRTDTDNSFPVASVPARA